MRAGRIRRAVVRTVPLALAPLAGWWLADWLWLGNPFHPFLSGIFPELAWNPGLQAAMHENVMNFTPHGVPGHFDWLAAPFRILSGARFGSPVLAAAAPA